MSFPSPVDCLAGTPFSPRAMISAEQEPGTTPPFKHFHDRCASFDRMHLNAPDGSIPFIGDSITEGMALSAISPYALNFGIASDTMRGVTNRINRPNDILHRAGAAVILIGINDICYEQANGGTAYSNCTYMWDLLAAWMTGKWVIIKVLPVNEAMFPSAPNSVIDAINSYIASKFSGRSGFAVLDAKPALAPSGQLDPAYTVDGLHLSAAGYNVLRPMVANALASIL